MKAIADELIRITTLLGVDYLRASSLNQAATINHYKDVSDIICIYAGFGNATLTDSTEGTSYQSVEVTVYVMKRQPVVDELAENIDIILAEVERVCESIRSNYATQFPISYTLEYITTDPDMLVGYLMTFSVVIDAAICLPPAP